MGHEALGLRTGDRVRLSGGYDMEPPWLSGVAAVEGTVASFIPGQNKQPAAVIKLDVPLVAKGATGDTLVLELRYEGATWGAMETVHVELCDFTPEVKRWKDRRQGKWIESHATCERLSG